MIRFSDMTDSQKEEALKPPSLSKKQLRSYRWKTFRNNLLQVIQVPGEIIAILILASILLPYHLKKESK